MEARLIEGFSTVKLRVHDFDEAVDIRQVTETARAVGDRAKIAVDANQGWRVTIVGDSPLWDLERAKRFADVCADVGAAWIEEPLAMDAYEDLSILTRYNRVPIAGGELHSSGLPELRSMIERGCYDIFQPDALFNRRHRPDHGRWSGCAGSTVSPTRPTHGPTASASPSTSSSLPPAVTRMSGS